MERPDWVRRINFLGDAVGAPRHLVSLDPNELVEIAQRNTGLTDFGGVEWLPAYRDAMGAMHNSDTFHAIGRLLARAQMLRSLENRLLVTEKFKQCPEISVEPIESPVFIIGNPRTGTTVLFELLAQDPRFRAPLAWEANSPLPLPDHMNRAQIAQEEISQTCNDLLMNLQPAMRSMHELRWDIPAECLQIMEINCIPRFNSYDEKATRLEAVSGANNYHWHKKVLQLLQYGSPRKTWLLKCVSHINFIDRILDCYPDARFIFTHRDPAKSAPSILKLAQLYKSTYTNKLDEKNPALMLEYLKSRAENIIEQRRSGALGRRPVADILFRDLMSDPVASIAELYDDIGVPFIDEMKHKILDYLERKPRYKHGEYKYRAEDFGASTAEIRKLFGKYIAHYKVPLEAE